MVFFCCDGCGETLKKNKVDTHASRCRQGVSFSCVDCGVSFFGDDYRAHTSCMTEAERYEGKLYKPKKRNPQEEWMDIIETCARTAPAHLKMYLQNMSELDNIPRKEKQFRNFTANSLNLRGHGIQIVGEVWKLLNAERQKRTAAKQEHVKKQQEERRRKKEEEEKKALGTEKKVAEDSDDDSDSDIEDTKKSKESTKEISSTKSNDPVNKKKVKKLMKKALKKAPNRKMKLKALRKQLSIEMGLSKKAKKVLKDFLLEVPNSKKSKMLIDGKMISME